MYLNLLYTMEPYLYKYNLRDMRNLSFYDDNPLSERK